MKNLGMFGSALKIELSMFWIKLHKNILDFERTFRYVFLIGSSNNLKTFVLYE